MKTFTNHLKLNVILLKALGLWTDGSKFFSPGKLHWKYCLFMSIIIVGYFNLGQIIRIVLIIDDLKLFSQASYVLLSCLMITVKTFVFVFKWPNIRSLLYDMDEPMFRRQNDAEERVFRDTMQVQRKCELFFAISSLFSVSMWSLFPLIRYGEMLPFELWYPFDLKKSGYFEFCYIHEVTAVFYGSTTHLVFDGILSTLMAFATAQCNVLSYRLVNMRSYYDDLDSHGEELDHKMNELLIQCVQHHRNIVKFSRTFVECFHHSFFAQFASSIAGVCLGLYELTFISPGDHLGYVLMIMYQTTLGAQLIMYCWFANEITIGLEMVCSSIYECTYWIESSRKFKRNFLFFALNLQRVLKVTPFGLFTVGLSTFTYIYKTAWSVFLLLRSLQN